MKRFLKFLIKATIVILLLPLFVVFAIFLYGTLVNPEAQRTMEKMTDFLEDRKAGGNGFGGDRGFPIRDTGYNTERFYWMDDDHIVFQTNYSSSNPERDNKVFVWDLQSESFKPVPCDCNILGFREGKIYFARRYEDNPSQYGPRGSHYFSATLQELDDDWIVIDAVNLTDTIRPPSEKYRVGWRVGGQYTYSVKNEFREDLDSPRHKTRLMPEWGWVLRLPWTGPEFWDQSVPEMGFIDLGGQVYAEQAGTKVGDLPDLPPRQLSSIRVVYVPYLEAYWLAADVNSDVSKTTYLGLINRQGEILPYSWPIHWPTYDSTPLPARKGVFWSGLDYRESSAQHNGYGAFLRDADNRIHKVIQGSTVKLTLSPDGCKIAFYNNLDKRDRSKTSMKVFDACQSTANDEVLRDVTY